MIVLRRAKSAWDYGLIGIVAELVHTYGYSCSES